MTAKRGRIEIIDGAKCTVSKEQRIALINRLIPLARKEAKRKVRENGREYELREHKGEPYHHDFWTEYFHEAMDRLTKEQGLRSL